MAAKLSERQKKNIVAAYAAGGVSYVELAKKYDVSKETVRRIIKEDSDFVKKCDTIKNEAEEEAGKDLADAVYDRQTMAQELLDDILRSAKGKIKDASLRELMGAAKILIENVLKSSTEDEGKAALDKLCAAITSIRDNEGDA